MVWADSVETILLAGTWTNYQGVYPGEIPQIIILQRGSKRVSPFMGITLKNDPEDPEYTFNGVEISTEKSGVLEIYARNTTDRDNIFADIKDIFQASSSDLRALNMLPIDYRNSYSMVMDVPLLD